MKKVLFVCVHNSGRSQMAEAFFNQLSKGDTRAFSAGTNPDQSINSAIAELMMEESINITGQVPTLLVPEMIDQADKIITMGCGVESVCPASYIPTDDWGLDDPKGQSIEKVRTIRDEIKTRVIVLLKELESDHTPED
ncbi:MAG: arsenate reductase ArsC [Planctomycetes bacterium]|nr:arsenate reductase ArsC [Planctomycetota bacterium]